MAPIRLRHPKGTSTLDVDVGSSTVQDLLQKIYEITEILPSSQDLKAGFPPRPLTIVPELPLDSLGLQRGDLVVVTQKAGTTPATSVAQSAPRVPQNAGVEAPRGVALSTGPESVPAEGGFLIHRVVPDDNACLFNSVALVFEQGIGKAQSVRETVAKTIREDSETWSEAILGHPREDYIRTILKPTSWGGAIELAILANHYKTEITSVDVETGRMDRFTPAASNTGNRCILIYSGIHYDAATMAPMKDIPPDFHQTIFPVIGDSDSSDPMLKAASDLVSNLRAKRAYTNTATFDLKCEICMKGLKGQKEAQQHAKETGHAAFGEY